MKSIPLKTAISAAQGDEIRELEIMAKLGGLWQPRSQNELAFALTFFTKMERWGLGRPQ